MSYDLTLTDPVTASDLHSDVKHDTTGGTFAVGGTTVLSLNVTYNYGKFFDFPERNGSKTLDALDGVPAADSIQLLQAHIDRLGNDVSNNYWDATEGNAKQALHKLMALAKMRPDGVWRVS